MKRIVFLFSLLILAITVNAQFHPRSRACYNHNYRVGQYVIVERPSHYIEERVVYVEKKNKPNNVIIINNNHNELTQGENSTEYFSLECGENFETKHSITNTSNFDYNDMWQQTIWFKRGSHIDIRPDGEITLNNVVRFLSEHQDAKIVLYGYASRKYGTYHYNRQLAEKRVKTVSNYLVNVYKINWSKIEMRVIGNDSAEYDVDKWNQCVIIKCERENE